MRLKLPDRKCRRLIYRTIFWIFHSLPKASFHFDLISRSNALSVLGALEQTVGVGVICTYPKVGSTEHWIRRYPSPLKPSGPKLVPCKFIYFRKDLLSNLLYFPFSIKDICYIQLYSHRHTMFFLCFRWTFYKLKVKIIHQRRLRLTLLQWSGTGPAKSLRSACIYLTSEFPSKHP